jgi:hypothetical protein
VSDRFPARRSRGGDLAAPVAALLLAAALATLALGATQAPGPAMLVLCVASAILAAAGLALSTWAAGYRRLAYALTETALRIDWLGRMLVLPYAAIHGIYAGQRLSGNATPSVPSWPGINIGSRWVRGLGRLRFYSTSSDQSQLTYITAEHGGVIVSARDPLEFQTALITRIERYDALAVEPEEEAESWHTREPDTAPWTALADVWLPVCVAVGTVVLLSVLAIITLRYDALPDQVAFHFDVGGQPSQIAPKSDLVRLPLLGLVCLCLNWLLGVLVHARERVLARLLWLVAVVVQVVLLIGVVRMVV